MKRLAMFFLPNDVQKNKFWRIHIGAFKEKRYNTALVRDTGLHQLWFVDAAFDRGLKDVLANVYHAYHVLRANRIPAENIIPIAYDDIANNPKNPFKGQVFHDYTHKDVYKDVVIDYRGKDVKPFFFTKVLTGDKKLEREGKKVLKSGPDDNVFVYYSGHGAYRYISFPEGQLNAAEFNDIFAHMHLKRKYNKLVLYMDSCNSGSMFLDILPPDVGIYVTTSAKEDEDSWAIFCDDRRIDACLATEYSYDWITDSETSDLKKRTLDQQYEEVKRRTKDSHVRKYGEMTMGSLPVGKFQGHYDLLMHQNGGAIAPNVVDKKPSSRVHLFSMSRRLMEATTEEEHEIAWRKLHRALQLGHIVKETFHEIAMDVTTHHKPTVKGLSKRDELMCFKAVFDHFRTHCFTIQQVPEVAQHTVHLMELCKAGYEAETLIQSVHTVCS
ncbi:hypothetical protein T265_05046 [Opisthorchis viverrini]|uniref:Legumain prodomain domain-containing protein n=1 Tax=Opisthorchis viverrini TaxID=6198 RepID=A0A074ZLN4_OPIVI|nr:hypothetical protein T265_05046 [Opisthorchis viverrini]KER27996.1 hypothetical protein T265_05046 [Opisthorchis viverrini]